MREVVFGLRDVLVAQTMTNELKSGLVVNRLPGPVALAQLLPGSALKDKQERTTLHHPGHGLPLAELRLLERTFPGVRFKAFRDINDNLPDEMACACHAMERDKDQDAPLRGKVIAVSTAHHRADLAALGYLTQHQDEALIHLLRPLLRLGADLLYGGTPPKRDLRAAAGEMANRNITLTLLQLLSDERRVVEIDRTKNVSNTAAPPGSMLFNLAAWPRSRTITPNDEASWINSCRIRRVVPADAGLPEWPGEPPGESDIPPVGFRRFLALIFSRCRELLAEGFECPVPGNLDRHVRPAAFVFIGGVLDVFKGVMPGVMEEFLRAAQADPAIPIYLMGGLGGATRSIARALLAAPNSPRPDELTQKHYQGQAARNGTEYDALLSELSKEESQEVSQQFEDLWGIIKSRRGKGRLNNLFCNGLSDQENRDLLETTNTVQAVSLIWTGMSRVLLPDAKAAEEPTTRARRRAAPARRRRGQ